jgi:hypothetical protein
VIETGKTRSVVFKNLKSNREDQVNLNTRRGSMTDRLGEERRVKVTHGFWVLNLNKGRIAVH